MTTRVFVYGTLKRGKENHHWLAGQHFEQEARTKPLYRMFDMGGYPALIRDESGVAVEGEIWQVDEAGLTGLDVLEDIDGGEYERVQIELEDERVEGYLYLRDVSGRQNAGVSW
jgi:gamma-glutamylaminecyclotransferase